MIIRAATISDVDDIFRLGSRVSEFQVSDEVVTFWPKEVLKRVIELNDLIFVAQEEEKIVGFIITNLNQAFGKAIIENIFVSPEWRGKGVSRQLLSVLLQELEKRGCEYVCALVEVTDMPGIQFW